MKAINIAKELFGAWDTLRKLDDHKPFIAIDSLIHYLNGLGDKIDAVRHEVEKRHCATAKLALIRVNAADDEIEAV